MTLLRGFYLGALVAISYLYYDDYREQVAWDYARAHPTPSTPSPIHYEISNGYIDCGKERCVTRIEPRCAWVDYATYVRIPCAMIMNLDEHRKAGLDVYIPADLK